MNKKLIAAAVAAAFATPMAASAEATIYGGLHAAVTFNDVEVGSTTTQDNITVDSNDATIGIDVTEDLGNGLTAIGRMEFSTDLDVAGTSIDVGEAYVGLSHSSFGALLMGTEDHPYKNAINKSGYNPNADKITDMDAIGANGLAFRQLSANNAIYYLSPNFNGVQVHAALVAPEGNGGDSSVDNGVNSSLDAYSLGITYAGGGLKVSAGYEDIDVIDDASAAGFTSSGIGVSGLDSSTNNATAYFIAGSYAFGDFQVGAAYESQSDAKGDSLIPGSLQSVSAEDVTAFGISGIYNFGNNSVNLVYVDEEQEDVGGSSSGVDADVQSWGITLNHNFSERSQIYVAYADSEYDEDGSSNDEDVTKFAVGFRHDF